MSCRRASCAAPAVLPAALLLGATIAAQGAAAAGRADATAVARAVEAWLASDLVDQALLERTVAAVLDDAAGLPWLGEQLRAAASEPAERRAKGLTALSTHVLLGFIARARKSGMVFRGQYAPLRALQPFAGDQLFQWLLATPDWFPDTHRIQLVPALRDLQPTPPAQPILLGVVEIARNTEIEPADLRLALACLLWQWGRKEFAELRLAELRQDSAEGDSEDRLVALRQLARLYYDLGDHARAAATHATIAQLAEHARLRLLPSDHYWSACCHALHGDVEGGIAALASCIAAQLAPATDAADKLPRRLFDQDPELERLRADARFAPLLERAFPGRSSDGKGR